MPWRHWCFLQGGGQDALATKFEAAGGIATDDNSIAIGSNSKAGNSSSESKGSIAIGPETKATGKNSVAIGQEAVASYIDSVATGNGAQASGQYSLALGANSSASKGHSIALGANSAASSDKAVALGGNAEASGNVSLAFGYHSKAIGGDSMAFGDCAEAQGAASIALGMSSSASSKGSISVGSSAKAEALYAVALGRSAQAKVSNGVALGSDSIAGIASGQTGYVPSAGIITDTSTPIWKSNLGAVSVGNSTEGSEKTRQIIHVAAGSQDTDAVNVAQLKASQTSLALASSEENLKLTANKTATGTSYTLSLDTSALQSTEVNAGAGVTVSKTGSAYTVTLKNDQTFGTVTADTLQVSGTGPSLKSTGISAANKTITAVAAGVDDTDAVNVAQLKASSSKLELETGESNLELTPSTTADGTTYKLGLSDDVTFTSVTANTMSVGSAVNLSSSGVQVGSNVLLSSQGLRITGGPSVTDEGIDAGGKVITNVADGSADTDAVNVGQLKRTVQANKSSVVRGSGIQVSSTTDAINGTQYTVSLEDSVDFDSVRTGNATLDSDGLSISGGPSVTGDGINAGGKKITNVARATLGTDAVNLDQMNEEIKKNKSSVAGGRGISVVPSEDREHGGTKYTVSLEDNIDFTSVTTGDTSVTTDGVSINGGPSMTKDGIDVAGKGIKNAGTISGVAGGVNDDEAVNVAQLRESVTNSRTSVKAKENGNITIEANPSEAGGTEYTVSLNDSVSVNEVHVAQNVHLSSEGVRIGNSGPIIAERGIDAANRTISNVAPGVRATDAVNVAQLNTAVNNVFRQVHSVEKDAQAGIAMAIATAGLPQAYLPGKSMMAISGGTYRGQSGYAFGFSHVTDNGRYVIKATGSGNSQGHFGASVGMGWQW